MVSVEINGLKCGVMAVMHCLRCSAFGLARFLSQLNYAKTPNLYPCQQIHIKGTGAPVGGSSVGISTSPRALNHIYTFKFGAIDVFQTNPFVYSRRSRVSPGFAELPLGAIFYTGMQAVGDWFPQGGGTRGYWYLQGICQRKGFIKAGDLLEQGIRWRRGFVSVGDLLEQGT